MYNSVVMLLELCIGTWLEPYIFYVIHFLGSRNDDPLNACKYHATWNIQRTTKGRYETDICSGKNEVRKKGKDKKSEEKKFCKIVLRSMTATKWPLLTVRCRKGMNQLERNGINGYTFQIKMYDLSGHSKRVKVTQWKRINDPFEIRM